MTTEQMNLVKSSFAKIEPISDKAAELFYGRLFEIRPDFKALFNTDMMQQGRKLMSAIKMAVDNLDDLAKVIGQIQDLGRRHLGYGVKKEYYPSVGEALLWTLGQGLGDDFTPQVKEAWTAVYGKLAAVMTEAAYQGT